MAFTFKLRTRDGAPADPPTLLTAAPSWQPGDTIPLGRRTLRVVEVRDGDADVGREPVLVVEDMAGGTECDAEPGEHQPRRGQDQDASRVRRLRSLRHGSRLR
jgi:hypothetical protein